MRTLPWGRLLVADFIVTVGTGIWLTLFLVPGLVFYRLFGLIGPGRSSRRSAALVESFRRTMRISRTCLAFVAALVV